MPETILIVDDDLDTLKLVGTTLEKQDYNIIAAKDGEQAVEMAMAEIPDLILLDVMMPKMDGYEVTRRLRANPDTEAIPIIIFTAKAQLEDKVEGLEVGADDYLTKPTHPTELVARVKSILKRSTVVGTRALNLETQAAPINRTMVGLVAPKGGLGLSSLAINLGVVLKEKVEAQVVVAEMLPGRGDVGVYLGYPNTSSLTDMLKKDAGSISRDEVQSALVSHATGISLLLSSRNPADAAFSDRVDQLDAITAHIASIASYTILDLGSSLTKGVQRLLKRCDHVVLVLESTPHTVALGKNMLEDLASIGVNRLKIHPILLNRMRTEQAMGASAVQKELGVELGTVFTPAPELAYQSAATQKPMVVTDPSSFTKQQVAKLAEALT